MRILVFFLAVSMLAVNVALADWPQFRGLNSAGVATGPPPPVQFGPGKNELWRAPMASGHSSPCVFGDSIVLTTYDEKQKKLAVVCIERSSGRTRWQRDVPTDQIEKGHPSFNPASSTPACDGQRVVAYFGSFGLICFDMGGRKLWELKMPLANQITFSWESRGSDLQLVFRPRFYQKHMGFNYYEPWTYEVWKGSVTGYCTWWSYRGGFTQETLDAMLAMFVEKRLPDFGYHYMQFDNCYQVGNGSCPQNWLNWDKRKYPGGWKYAVKAIREAGMKPGIWVHRIHRPSDPHVADIAKEHPDWFLHRPDGSLFTHRGFHVLNTTNEEAVDNMVRKLYGGLRQQGWDYVKIDGTGDLLRAYQNRQCDEFFKNHPTTPEQSLRKWDIVAREELGPRTIATSKA